MRILLVEDDLPLAEAIQFHLEKEGYSVDLCHDGQEALLWVAGNGHDLVILDRMLPGVDGLSVLDTMRRGENYTPVLMVTALDGVGDRVAGLDTGADDYLVKPFAVEELLARVRSLGRRPSRYQAGNLVSYGDLSLDVERHTVVCAGQKSLSLSKREAQLLEILLQNPGQVVPRGVLFTRVWGADAPVEDGNLDNYIHFLRKRLQTVGSRLSIKTVRSVGYCLERAGD